MKLYVYAAVALGPDGKPNAVPGILFRSNAAQALKAAIEAGLRAMSTEEGWSGHDAFLFCPGLSEEAVDLIKGVLRHRLLDAGASITDHIRLDL